MEDPEELALKFMMGEKSTTTGDSSAPPLAPPPLVVQTPLVAPPSSPLFAPSLQPSATPPIQATAVADDPPKSMFAPPSPETVRALLDNTMFRLAVVFVLVCLIMIVIQPPFVHDRSNKHRAPIEAAPLSYIKVFIYAGLATSIVVVVPILIKNQMLLKKTFDNIRKAIPMPTAAG